jgi:cytochrome c5
VPWFLWAQYDASIEQPLIRNAGEALGVTAPVNLSPEAPSEALFRSSIALENLVRIEAMLRGPDPDTLTPKRFGGLTSPKWPSQIFAGDPQWKIDAAQVSRGRAIYAEICAECHLGPVNDPTFDEQYPDKTFWTKAWDQKDPVLKEVVKAGMGTDPGQANVLRLRTVDVPGFLDIEPARDFAKLGCGDLHLPPSSSTEMKYAMALMLVVNRVSSKWMVDHSVSDHDQKDIWGNRKNCPNPILVSSPHYRARPLNGVWATAPYLHNGSVPSLYWLLRPAAERPKQFCIGARDYDPREVGYHVDAGETQRCEKGESEFRSINPDGSAVPGNSVLGHSLEGKPGQDNPGIIGRKLTDEERYDLIEYLKTL